MAKKRSCFVIMGYGVKTDYASGRVLNLDKTYENIIKPAVEELGLECIRADEIRHSGIIDVPMYEYLVGSDIVIADLSTSNSNAFYELGVRHALRPYTTIAISENELKKPFDVDHTVVRHYEHLGTDIGFSEVMRFRTELQGVIEEILDNPKIDSPVYTYLSNLTPPQWDKEQKVVRETDNKETLGGIIENAKEALDSDDFISAKALFQYAYSMDKNSSYVVQQLTLATYKSKFPSQLESLYEALKILANLSPDNSTDPETLGLAGAIYKRLWEETKEVGNLDKSIFYYEKGFYIKNDYYNGINLAYLLNVRGSESSGNEAIADYVTADRIRKQVINICEELRDENFENRSDKYWVLATLEESYLGLGLYDKYNEIKAESEQLAKNKWERETTDNQINKLSKLLEKSPLQ